MNCTVNASFRKAVNTRLAAPKARGHRQVSFCARRAQRACWTVPGARTQPWTACTPVAARQTRGRILGVSCRW